MAPVAMTYTVFQFQKKKIKKEIKRRMIAGMDRDELIEAFLLCDLIAELRQTEPADSGE